MMLKIPELVGTGNVGSVIATATARHALTDGAEKGHLTRPVVSRVMMHGYALANSMKSAGAKNTATIVPSPWARNCCLGDVRSKKPTRKSPTRSAACPAPMEAKEPPSRLRRCACWTFQCSPLVAPPSTIWDAFDAAVRGVTSVTPVHCTASSEKKKARKIDNSDMPTGISYCTPITTQVMMITMMSNGAQYHLVRRVRLA